MTKAKIEARQAIQLVESQLKFLNQAECFNANVQMKKQNLYCSINFNSKEFFDKVEEELKYLENLPPKEKNIEVRFEMIFDRLEVF